RFKNVGEEREKTTASAFRRFKHTPQPDQTHERLKKILNKKRTQHRLLAFLCPLSPVSRSLRLAQNSRRNLVLQSPCVLVHCQLKFENERVLFVFRRHREQGTKFAESVFDTASVTHKSEVRA